MSKFNRLFVFEGGDGVGKTTLLRAVMDTLYTKHKVNVVSPRTWNDNPVTQDNGLKSLMYNDASSPWVKVLAATTQRRITAERVVGNLNRGHVVLLDRWIPSTVAYNTARTATARPCADDVYDIHRRILADLGGDPLISPTTFYITRKVATKNRPDDFDLDDALQTHAEKQYTILMRSPNAIIVPNDGAIEDAIKIIVDKILSQINGSP